MKYIFVSFASSDMKSALNRIERQARDCHVFDSIYCITERDLKPAFLSKLGDRLKFGSRGFGYWCWKPQVVLQAMEAAENGDVILFCDAGCHLRPKGRDMLIRYRDIAFLAPSGILAFEIDPSSVTLNTGPKDFREELWTKEDVFLYFKVSKSDPIRTSNQFISGIFALRVEDSTHKLISDWLQAYLDEFSLADDSASKSVDSNELIENRHDQSIFSILLKKNNPERRNYFELVHEGQHLIQGEPGILALRDKRFTFVSRKKRQLAHHLRKISRLLRNMRNQIKNLA